MIVDLRDYTTTHGNRDRLIERCERVLFPVQEKMGARILGLFRDAEDPDRFVWLRAMPDMPTRKRVLTAFYTNGDLWKAQRAEVNRWIANSDDVLLLTPLGKPRFRRAKNSVVIMYQALGAKAPRTIAVGAGKMVLAAKIARVKNNYPRHPVREGESGRVWFVSYEGEPPEIELPGVTARRLLPTRTSRLR